MLFYTGDTIDPLAQTNSEHSMRLNVKLSDPFPIRNGSMHKCEPAIQRVSYPLEDRLFRAFNVMF